MVMPHPSTPVTRRILLGGAGLSLLAGCGAVTKSGGLSAAHTASPSPIPDPAVLAVTPADRADGVAPTTPVTVTATKGSIVSVSVTDEKGTYLPGKVDAHGVWTSGRFLRPSATYTIAATAKGRDGTTTSHTSTFTTLKPGVTATYGLPYSGATVGIGMPVSIQFDSQVATKEMRAQVEKLVTVTTEPQTEGAWGWLDNRQLMWRPKEYWKPGTKVTVSAPIAGVQTGNNKWVGEDQSGGFTIGDAMVSHIDIPAHMMTVTRNGAVLRTIPVSNGRPGPDTETRSGTKVIIERLAKVTMDSTTIGIPEGSPGYYKVDTNWNLRVTWTGEFLHSAPWSVGAQGNSNVSHGCTNMSPADAEWMFNQSKVGDVVEATGSSRTFQPTEGIGVWQFSFDQWKANSALVS